MNTGTIFPRRKHRAEPLLNLVPMIDTVFVLLLFFAVAYMLHGLAPKRVAMTLHLPSAQSSEPVTERVILSLAPGQPVQVNGKPVGMKEIGPELKLAAGGNLDTQVVVMADAKVPYSQLIAAVDEVRLADFTRIALATTPKQPTPPAAGTEPR